METLEYQTTHCIQYEKKKTSPPGFEPGTFRLTAERANRLRHGDRHEYSLAIFRISIHRFYRHL